MDRLKTNPNARKLSDGQCSAVLGFVVLAMFAIAMLVFHFPAKPILEQWAEEMDMQLYPVNDVGWGSVLVEKIERPGGVLCNGENP